MQDFAKQRNIILTGFMGTGKTTVGKLLADLLGYGFVDTDDLIEARHGRSIPQIFAESGEAAFRQMERDMAQALAEQEDLVIATGGRLMLDPVNVAALGQNGRIFCLVATPEEILMRVMQAGVAERPLLSGDNPQERIATLLQERREKYAQFPQINTDNLEATAVARQLADLITHDKQT
jgi:shikimate kinase